MIDEALLRRRPRPPLRAGLGIDCLCCGDEIPAERRAVLPNCCLCVDCQDDAEKAMGR